MQGEAAGRADVPHLRYAQCWEDADILLEALDVQPGDACLSIASGGDNTLALLTRDPAHVLAIDVNPAQLAALDLKMAAFRELDHDALLELFGSRPSRRRPVLYTRCRSLLSPGARRFWDGNSAAIARGLGSAGRFERYLDVFRRYGLPLVHGPGTIDRLFATDDAEERTRIYREEWNTWRWRMLCRLFFSRRVMQRRGRDASYFRYADASLSEHVLHRTRRVLTELPPAENPYLQWLLTGTHRSALPLWLRLQHFETIRRNLDRVELRRTSLENVTRDALPGAFRRLNLSNVFEYMSEAGCHAMLTALVRAGGAGARLVYWNMLVPRSRPESMADTLRPLQPLADRLAARDKLLFYRAFVVEEVV